MYNFFTDKQNRQEGGYYIDGTDFNHIKNVLRMKHGEQFFVSCEGKCDLCQLERIEGDYVFAKTLQEDCSDTELGTDIILFQGLPKGDKMELIIQKAVELGVKEIVPTEMSRCVVKLDDKKKKSKLQRWQAISESAAKQSKRNIIPEICPVMSFAEALKKASICDLVLVPYENAEGMKATRQALNELKKSRTAAIFIGPEGGFDQKEIDLLLEKGGKSISLGKRILRTETAAVAAVGLCMLFLEMGDEE